MLVPLPHLLPRPQTSDEWLNWKIQKYLPDGLNHIVLPPRSSWVTPLLPSIIHTKPIPPNSRSRPDITLYSYCRSPIMCTLRIAMLLLVPLITTISLLRGWKATPNSDGRYMTHPQPRVVQLSSLIITLLHHLLVPPKFIHDQDRKLQRRVCTVDCRNFFRSTTQHMP